MDEVWAGGRAEACFDYEFIHCRREKKKFYFDVFYLPQRKLFSSSKEIIDCI